jgi:hypothetical protein
LESNLKDVIFNIKKIQKGHETHRNNRNQPNFVIYFS